MTASVAHRAESKWAGWSYAQRKARAQTLADAWPFAAEVLQFYSKLLDVQAAAYEAARAAPLAAHDAVAYAAHDVLPRIVAVSAEHGPATLQHGVLERLDAVDFQAIVRAWLQGEPLDGIDRYLARAATAPLLEALGPQAGDACEGTRSDRTCPVCCGLPQSAFVATTDDDLVTPHRYLACSRCSSRWPFTRLTCASCGEAEPANLPVYNELGALEGETTGRTVRGTDPDVAPNTGIITAERARLPHVRIDGCRTCFRYLLTIDVRREPRAVPVVDELAALPFYVYAQERGLAKILPNQLGF